jgi:acetyl esterase/lipase
MGETTKKRWGSIQMALKTAWAVVAAMIMTATAASAQPSPMPPETAARLKEIGRVVDPPNTAHLYAPLQQKEPYPGVKIERDVKYGPADLNVLDVFIPEAAAAARPVLMYVHGGAFIAGNKRGPNGSPFYDNIMLWAARNGFVGINVNYRLAPQSTWPAAVEDLALAVQWVSDKIRQHGGDPARVYLMGHSAGAVHVASYVSHPEFYKIKDGGLAGAIFVSGIFDLNATPAGDPEKTYFGADPARYAERSSFKGLVTTKTPLMIVTAELDPPNFNRQFDLLKKATCKGPNGCARALLLPQHSHMSEMYAVNTADTRLTDPLLEFIRNGK